MALLMLGFVSPTWLPQVENPGDLYDKVVKAKNIQGTKYIEILALLSGLAVQDMAETVQHSRMAVRSGLAVGETDGGKIGFRSPTAQIINGKAGGR